ncbi:Hint domain-containing protein [Paracoccus sp. PAR01]|uniref:Hint domain-containing protein n=1 Tax=Paracoccus sp. PAR01 TaxID=2769282 RepID=UPI0017828666|nr:Hint domain-containing protein [Paracoccus sp. PAR01]MBD9527837.1 Hint domain-containing protein [Paracoccus sp. PAR01]
MPIFSFTLLPPDQFTIVDKDGFDREWALDSVSGEFLPGSTLTVAGDATTTPLSVTDDDDQFEDDDTGDGYNDNGAPQLLTSALTVNGTTWPVGSLVEAEYTITALDPATGDTYELFAIRLRLSTESRIEGQIVGFSFGGDIPLDVPLTIVSNTDSQLFPPVAIEVPYEELVVCFASGTFIETANGPVPVNNLVVGDRVLTADNEFQEIRWIGFRQLDRATLERNPNLCPVRIRAGALAPGLPETDLIVSPQHRVLVTSEISRRMFGTKDVLVAAKHLLAVNGIDILTDIDSVTYWHFLLNAHQIVMANGVATESLYTGPQALKSIDPAAVSEIFAIFPELADPSYVAVPARQIIGGRGARRLADRSVANRKPLAARQSF